MWLPHKQNLFMTATQCILIDLSFLHDHKKYHFTKIVVILYRKHQKVLCLHLKGPIVTINDNVSHFICYLQLV